MDHLPQIAHTGKGGGKEHLDEIETDDLILDLLCFFFQLCIPMTTTMMMPIMITMILRFKVKVKAGAGE